MLIKNFNNLLALLMMVVIIPGLWIISGLGIVTLSGEVIGATITGWVTIIYFFFRKAPPNPVT